MITGFQFPFGIGVGPAVANHLWQSTVFATVAWLMTRLLRKNRAQVRYRLWLTASVKFLIPFSLLIGLGSVLPRPPSVAAQPALYSAVDIVAQPFNDHATLPAASTAHGAGWRGFLTAWLPLVLSVVWLCGAMTVLLVWYARRRQVCAILRRAAPVEDGRELTTLRRLENLIGGNMRITLMRSRELMEPGIFGILRLVLIWPEQLSELLEDDDIEAILWHEVVHARRHDNLTAALHMVVEAAFWFHPVVWFMERRMLEERERACDEAVVRWNGRPEVYAASLLKTCRFCVQPPLPCMSGVSGADLNSRIVSIMTTGMGNRLGLGKILLLAAIGTALVAGPFAAGFVNAVHLRAQLLHADGPLPSFEVASIKPGRPDDTNFGFRITPARFQAENASLISLIRFAYSIRSDAQLPKGPSWIGSEKFDLDAKFAASQVEALKKLTPDERFDQYRLMVQSLLSDRFKLKLRSQPENLPVYTIVVAKGGPKLKEVQGGVPPPPSGRPGPPPPPPPPGATLPPGAQMPKLPRLMGGEGHLTAGAVSMPFLTDWLYRQPEMEGRVIIDETGLKGNYDFELNWMPDESHATSPNETGDGQGSAGAPPREGPSIFTALQEQLGLKLVPNKAPVEVLIIDHVEKPSPD